MAYSLAPVGPDAVGGAEQVLSAIDRALVAAGHRSLVVSCRGSRIAGEWIDTGVDPDRAIDVGARSSAVEATRRAVAAAVSSRRVDLVHLHGLDFDAILPAPGPPALVTLHLPSHWYAPDALALPRPLTWLHCVSASQARHCPGSKLLGTIANGVAVEALQRASHARRRYALMLGRVCPEKGQHLALQAARRADVPLLLGGTVFGYPAHRDYFERAVAPLLDRRRRFLGPLAFDRKRRLLSAARCVLIPSLAEETSSLVAMEAAACGTPVIAFRSGALADLVVEGVTGFLVGDADEMGDRIGDADSIDPEACRRLARKRFSHERMCSAYLERYRELVRA